MVAYKLPQARALGVEAQAVSFGLAQRNVERNGQRGRIALQHGDLRDLRAEAGRARVLADLGTDAGPQLISGTPPYMPVGTSTPSPDEQRRYARKCALQEVSSLHHPTPDSSKSNALTMAIKTRDLVQPSIGPVPSKRASRRAP